MDAKAASAAEKLGEAAVERRERRPVELRGRAVRQDGSGVEIFLLNLSYEGCGIKTPVELKAGEQIELSVMGRGGVDAEVRWCRRGRAGLVFTAKAPAEKQHWPRRHDRVPLSAEVSMRRLGNANFRVRVVDASPSGCCVELVDKPRIEEHVLVKFDGLEALDSEVCWIEGNIAGLRFEKTIHPAVFELLLARLGEAATVQAAGATSPVSATPARPTRSR